MMRSNFCLDCTWEVGVVRKGSLFVFSGPSGVGKGTVLENLLDNYKEVVYSISATTRPRREGEMDGEDYFFLSDEIFFEMVKENKFIEWAKVHDNYYGTPRDFVDKTLEDGKDIILEIDIQGAKMVRNNYPDAVYIFLSPPSMEELENRLNKRGTENEKNKAIRLRNAQIELREKEKYNYQIINDNLNEAVDKLRSILIAEKCRIRK